MTFAFAFHQFLQRRSIGVLKGCRVKRLGLAVNGGAIPGHRGGAKAGQLGENTDMQRGPIGPLCMSAAKKFLGYVGEISPVSGSMVCSAAG